MNMGQERQMQMVGGCLESKSSECRKSEWANWCSRKCQSKWEWNITVRPRRRDAAYLQTQLLITQKKEAGIQLQAKKFDLVAAAADLDEIEKVNANCILMENLQQASTSGTPADKAPVYDSNGSAEKFMGAGRLGNDHVAAILGFSDLQWGNILITGFILLKDWVTTCSRNDLVSSLLKFKYHKEHLYPSCEQGKSKRASHPPKLVPNSRQQLHLLHMDLSGPMRIASINGKRITVLLQSPVIIIRTDNGTEFKNQVLKEYFDSVGISHQMSSVRTPQQNGVVERRNWTLVEATRTMLIFSRVSLFLCAEAIAIACFTQNRSIIHRRFNKTPYKLINGRKLDISFLYVFRALCYPKNDREDIRKLGAKGDIGFFIGYSADSCAYRIYNRRTKKIIETMNVSFDELSAMAFEQRCLKPRLQSMTSGQISPRLDLTYAPSTITTQQPFAGKLGLLFEAMYDDYIGGQPSATARTFPAAQEPQVQQQGNQAHLQSTTVADNVLNAMFDGNTFINPFANPSTSAAESSSSQNVDPSNMHTFYQPYPHEFQWTKYHPLEQVIGEPSRPILTRNQLRSDGDMCMYALTNKHDEKQTVIQNKSRLVMRGYRQEEGIDFEESFASDSGFELTRFSDADYAGCKDTYKSTSGGAQFLGEKLVSWSSKKQDCTTLSTVEAEYVSLSACCAQVLWMQTQLTDYGFHFNKILIYYDSKSAIAISYNPVQHSRTKHIVVRYHFIKEHVEKGTIELYFVKTDYQLAYLFTKALPVDRFNYLVHRLGMRSLSPQELDRLAKS
uniref:Retrovirus-related Pol polyprotein from transposon TNT 1-94 n=1 Tax=Tanacetum cinerariifolium TaxID=118510 RepID=A0A6L2JCG4_TANCI|nr:retrovirus-related Pol polyprotein from transposon TNT 1-94 [Tanacetum cinerariifolium]